VNAYSHIVQDIVGRGGRVPRKSTEVRQTQIVDAATRIIATRGARRFTAQLLATEIGVTPGAIFRHFKSMDAIVGAVVDQVETTLAADYPPPVENPLERLHVFFQRRVRTIARSPHLSRMLLSDQLAQAGGRRPALRVQAFKARSQAFVLGCLREAERRGELKGDAGPEVGAVLVIGAIFALAHTSTRVLGRSRIERLSAQVWATIEGALVGDPGRPAKRSMGGAAR
jgi:AcrR family transcriptional regulator